MKITVVGNPGHRRIAGFAAAALAAGLPEPRVVPWADVLRGAALDFAPGPVRIDSPGEDPAVHALLGGPADPHRVEGGAVRHAALLAGLGRVRDAAAAVPGGAWLTHDPDDVAVLFDKPRAHARLRAAGVEVPRGLGPDGSGVPVGSYAELRELMHEARCPRVFVKPAHGSSASGVVALETAGPRVQATTSAELVRTAEGVQLFNSLRIRKYRDAADVAALVDALCADGGPGGVHVEAWLPKLTLGGLAVDLRVLVVAGRATHVVARGSRSPMTNLHLGNARADADAVRAAVGDTVWDQAMTTCVRAAGCFPRTLHVGVDLLFAVDRRRHAVGEVNAFGDLLPGVAHRGRDTWGEQVRALVEGWRPHGPVRPAGQAASAAPDEDPLPCPT
ncbi:STM4014 family protein [Yinghuangia soli]|uniref:STM4014 family protein n=1 Tax=Yinghuangia soli TaxID=2908204 RepID=A0AA41PWB5_9ACTN|nr:STM4014 family protein [Yinghuangia soli]MCF2525687.1 STM4014 family protein [Yinghuangia soli]